MTQEDDACPTCPFQVANNQSPSTPNGTSTTLISATNAVITGGQFNQTQINNAVDDKLGFKALFDASAPSAFYNAGHDFDLPKCHPGTRVTVLEKIQDWIRGDPKPPVMWVYGAVGAGKSAIARSTAERCNDENSLLATFFFCRSDRSRNNFKRLVPTLAYGVIQSVPEIRPIIEQVLESHPHIFYLSVKDQIRDLILKPLSQVTQAKMACHLPHVIIIDGLDECVEVKEREDLLKLFSSIPCREIPFGLKFLLVSRPESDIRNSFNDAAMRKLSTWLALSDDYKADDDIRSYLEAKFTDIKAKSPSKSHLPPEWPPKDDIDELVRKSSGQFIYPATVIKYLSSGRLVKARLRTVLSTSTNGQTELPFAQLDALYVHLLESAGNDEREAVSQTLAVCFLMPGCCVSQDQWPYINRSAGHVIADVLDLDIELVDCILEDLSSVLQVKSAKVNLYHASLSEFLFDADRSRHLWADQSLVWSKLIRSYLRFLSKTSDYALTKSLLAAAINGIGKAKNTEQLTQGLILLDSTLVLAKIPSKNSYNDSLHQSWIRFLNLLKTTHHSEESYCHLVSTYDHWLAGVLHDQCSSCTHKRARVFYDSIQPHPRIAFVVPSLSQAHTHLDWAYLFSNITWSTLLQNNQLPKVRERIQDNQISAVMHCIHVLVENAVTDRLVHFSGPDRRISRPWLWRRSMTRPPLPLRLRDVPGEAQLHRHKSFVPFGATLSIMESFRQDESPTMRREQHVYKMIENALETLPRLLDQAPLSSQLPFSLRVGLTLACRSRKLEDVWRKARKAMRRYLVDVAGFKAPRLGFAMSANNTTWQHRGVGQFVGDWGYVRQVLRVRMSPKTIARLRASKPNGNIRALQPRVPTFDVNKFFRKSHVVFLRGWQVPQKIDDLDAFLEPD